MVVCRKLCERNSRHRPLCFDENLVSGESFILQIENNKAHIAKLEADTFSVRMTSFDFSKSSCAVDECKITIHFEDLDIPLNLYQLEIHMLLFFKIICQIKFLI